MKICTLTGSVQGVAHRHHHHHRSGDEQVVDLPEVGVKDSTDDDSQAKYLKHVHKLPEDPRWWDYVSFFPKSISRFFVRLVDAFGFKVSEWMDEEVVGVMVLIARGCLRVEEES